MKFPILQSISVCFLMLLFVGRGLVIDVPALTGLLFSAEQKEMNITTEAENNTEKAHEKTVEIKEFIGHTFEYDAAHKYAVLLTARPAAQSQFIKGVYLPILTPPPDSAC